MPIKKIVYPKIQLPIWWKKITFQKDRFREFGYRLVQYVSDAMRLFRPEKGRRRIFLA
jgi:hypothetical protein